MTLPTRLLVSVRSAEEARTALAGGADILDVKEPSHGSLGRADPAVWQNVLGTAGGQVPVTLALGELAEQIGQPTLHVPKGICMVKVGLAGSRGTPWQDAWRSLRDRLTCHCFGGGDVPPPGWAAVAYADWQRAAAPEPLEVARFAIEHRCAALLIDTWHKDGTTLLDWLSQDHIGRLSKPLRALGVLVALAGSLREEHIGRISSLRPDVIAVRGAACRRGQRDGTIDADAVARLAVLIRSSTRNRARQAVSQRDF